TIDKEKLSRMTDSVRIGGKAALKKLPMNVINQVEEVDMFKSDGSVMIFKQPKGINVMISQVTTSYNSNMYTVVGLPEIKNQAHASIPGNLLVS
ncbi:hypothetical protein MXB_2622, partial [Myxobolus squamalis]